MIDGYDDVKPLRQNNSFIMKGFQNAKVSKSCLSLLNTMRLSLKVVTLADIVTADGKRITTNAWAFKQGNRLCDKHEWPRSPRTFTQQQIQIWQESLHKAFGGSTCQSKEIKQEFYLGTWYKDVTATWTTHVNPVTMRLYKKGSTLY